MCVVHCKKSSYDVYIGRGSEWGNPFVIGKHGNRAEVIEQYRLQLIDKVRSDYSGMVNKLASLHGKTLACYCAPLPCHGDVLVKASKWAVEQLKAN